jgi:hypothetical protein
MNERRSESRMLCADLVEVCWSDETGQSCSAMANLEEVSPHGAHLVVDVALPLHTDLVLRMKRGDMTATVRDCRHEPDFGFAVAVQLPKKSRWKSHPRHLFDPRGLERRESARNRMLSGQGQSLRQIEKN